MPGLIASAAQRSSGKVLVVGSASAAARPRSAFHAVLQAAQSTGIPCVPFTPRVAAAGTPPARCVGLFRFYYTRFYYTFAILLFHLPVPPFPPPPPLPLLSLSL